jgi:heme/copper-type cytochrome/quinol oxidase subunit 2
MNKERLKGEIFDAIMWLIAFTIKISVIGLVIYSVIRFVKWSWNC